MLQAASIAWRLAARAEDLARQLFPDAEVRGNELRWDGPDGAKWSLVCRGSKAGVWCDWGDPDRCGDALELVHHALFPDESGRRDSLLWAARWLGDAIDEPVDPAVALAHRRAAFERQQRREAEHKAKAERARRYAKARYLDGNRSVPVPCSPEIESYLCGRLGLAALDELDGLPRGLRFTNRSGYDAHLDLPAMLAPVIHLQTSEQIATHTTYLQPDAAGRWHKARVGTPKKTHGSYKGGVIPLLRGASGKPLKEAPDGDRILIAEGIENALAASLYVGGEPRVVACVTVNNLPALELPAAFTEVILVLDRDGENEAVRRSRETTKAAWLAEGRRVNTWAPEPGFKDWADYASRDGKTNNGEETQRTGSGTHDRGAAAGPTA